MRTFVREYGGEEGRPVWPALNRGLHMHCPSCGEGKIFRAYLKVADRCAVCGEELFHHRADDMPPYVTLVIVGHFVLASVLLQQDVAPDIPQWAQMVMWPMFGAALSLVLLPIVKGAIVAYQWALKMHGFDHDYPEDSW